MECSQTPPLSVEDFASIHGVLRAVLTARGVNAADMRKSCIFFALAGAYLLVKKHALTAKPVAGAAFFALAERNGMLDILTFAKPDEKSGEWCSDLDAFHAWVEVIDQVGATWIVDFTSPLYAEAIQHVHRTATAPYRAFVQSEAAMLKHPAELQFSTAAPGDFYVHPSQEHTELIMKRATQNLELGDLVDVAAAWYVPSPGHIEPSIRMGSNTGETRRLEIRRPRLSGYWRAPGGENSSTR